MKDTLRPNEPIRIAKTKLTLNVMGILSILHIRKPNDYSVTLIVIPKPRMK